MKSPAPPGLVADSRRCLRGESPSPERFRVDKSSRLRSVFSLLSDSFPLATVTITASVTRRLTRPLRVLTQDRASSAVSISEQPVPPAVRCGTAEAERAKRARTAIGRKRPPCHGGPTRPALDRRESGAPGPDVPAPAPPRRRSRSLHLTFVRTTQERPTLADTGDTAVARWLL